MHHNQDPIGTETPPPGHGIGRGMLYAGWVVILGLLTMVFSNWEESRFNPNREVTSIVRDGSVEVRLLRNKWGHYVANGTINGKTVTFLLDTGATFVSVPGHIAGKLGLKKEARTYSSTANGTIEVFMTHLDSLTLGGIEMNRVRASINPHMEEDEILLGMSVLQHLEMVQKGNTLILRL